MDYHKALFFLQKELSFLSNPQQEAKWILEHILNSQKDFQKIFSDVTDEQWEEVLKMASLRKKGFPLQYILGNIEFLGLSFDVCQDVLIPREDSSVLVDYMIKMAPQKGSILEIGIGSGVLALTLKKYRPDLNIVGLDHNSKAIECTRHNEQKILGNSGHIQLIQEDFFQFHSEVLFDVVLSNPPYLSEEEWIKSEKELFFEPKDALVGGRDGLLFYKSIFEREKEFSKTRGFMVLEISPLRFPKLREILEEKERHYEILYDLHHQERGLVLFGKDYPPS